jgi:DNA-binding HxlR family transcriptional regulator
MRLYEQHCAAACALDVIGDRWSLLIVRELLWRDCRYAELADGLPGIASNLLTDRLRALEHSGVLERHAESVSDRSGRYRLTERGRQLAPVLRELTMWGAPLLLESTNERAVRGRWVASAADALFHGVDTRELPPLNAILHAHNESVRLTVTPGRPVHIAVCTGDSTDDATVQVWADQPTMLHLLLGAPTDAQITGDKHALDALIAHARDVTR